MERAPLAVRPLVDGSEKDGDPFWEGVHDFPILRERGAHEGGAIEQIAGWITHQNELTENGELRPEFYDGFIPYFMAKGARGVVGTECKTPAVFASEWALRFFPRFLDGEPLGDIFLELRREFHTQHGNPLGLLYNLYCDADTRIQPGLTI